MKRTSTLTLAAANPEPRLRRLPALAGAILLSLTAAGATAQTAPAAASAPAAAASGPMLGAAVIKPLQAAEAAIKAADYPQALARLAEAEAIPGLTAYEIYFIRRMKAPAAFGAGDIATAITLFESVLDSPLLPAADRLPMMETTIKLVLQQKEYPRAARWMKVYLDSQGSNAEIVRLYPQVLSVVGDHAGVVRELAPLLAADAAAARATPEATLRMLAASQSALKDNAGYAASLERLATSTGKSEYWAELIVRTQRREGFADDRLRLDVYRLRQAVGVTLAASELGDMAFRAYQVGLPAEALKLLDDGFASGLLGKDANAAADQKLREQAAKAAAQDRSALADSEAAALKGKDGNAATALGLAVSAGGAQERALVLLNQGQAKGGLRRPDEAMLHLGLVQWRAGHADEARRSFAAVSGNDGSADLARLWGLYLDSLPRK